MIDELVHDALAAQVDGDDAGPEAWTRIQAAGRVATRRRRQRTAGVLAAATAVVVAIVGVGLSQGTPTSEKVATAPTNGTRPTAPQIAPPPAANVAHPAWQARTLRSGFSVVTWVSGGSWSAARTAGDGRDLVLSTSGCGDRFGAVVQERVDRVSVQLAVVDGPHLSCLMTEQVRVRLASPLGHRSLVDGQSGYPAQVLDGSTLLVPHDLPTGMRFQTESVALESIPGSLGPPGSGYRTWRACYQADLPPSGPGQKAAKGITRCVFTGSRPMVTTAQSDGVSDVLDTGVLAQDSITAGYSYGYSGGLAYSSGSSSPQPGRSLPHTSVDGGIGGHPADMVSTGLHDVVVWTDGTTWFSVATPHGVGGVSPAELIRIAQSMRPVA